MKGKARLGAGFLKLSGDTKCVWRYVPVTQNVGVMISVFLSSTFQDMQLERDIIQKFVLPQVEQYAHKNYETLNIVDLR